MPREKLFAAARDELFSHINRCGVLSATGDDQDHWMDETIEYLGERFPDLSDGDLSELRSVGVRFCQPAVAHGAAAAVMPSVPQSGVDAEDAVEVDGAIEAVVPVEAAAAAEAVEVIESVEEVHAGVE